MANMINRTSYDDNNPTAWIDMTKSNIKYHTIKYCKKRWHKINQQISNLIKSSVCVCVSECVPNNC